MKRRSEKRVEAENPGRAADGLYEALAGAVWGVFDGLAEVRRGGNVQYTMGVLARTAFGVFYMKSPSFLEGQRAMQGMCGKSNAGSFFGVADIPTDGQVRSVLDRVGTGVLLEAYDAVLEVMEGRGLLDGLEVLGGMLAVALDGTWYHSSEKIGCDNCTVVKAGEGEVRRHHSVLTPAIVSPDMRGVAVPVRPEFVVPQDGHEKQDCEIAAAKRALPRLAALGARKAGCVLLGDDLYSRQPFCRQAALHGLHFLFTCKEESHKTLYEWVTPLDASTGLVTVAERRETAPGVCERWEVRFAKGVPLADGEGSMRVNWLAAEVTDRKGGVYSCAWVTDMDVTEANAVELARLARARWRIENEHNNTLKCRGYHLEHNFGHGKANLSCNLAALNILAFLLHTAQWLAGGLYAEVRELMRTRRAFHNALQVLAEFFYWSSFEQMLLFMVESSRNGSRPPPPRT